MANYVPIQANNLVPPSRQAMNLCTAINRLEEKVNSCAEATWCPRNNDCFGCWCGVEDEINNFNNRCIPADSCGAGCQKILNKVVCFAACCPCISICHLFVASMSDPDARSYNGNPEGIFGT